MKVIKPTTVTPSSIISSSLTETTAAWSSATAYSIGNIVHDGLSGVYQALTANTNKQPSLNPTDWLYIRPSNRWAVFDSEVNTASTATTSMTFKLATGAVQGLALLNLNASTVSVSIADSRGWEYQTNLAATAWGTGIVRAVAWSGSQFCAVGDGGRVATSPDGNTWTYQGGLLATAWSNNTARAIAWTGAQFCAVGDNGRVATSPDGVTWTYRSGLTSTGWSTTIAYAIAWTGTQFCIAGASGKVATSPDGITWTNQTSLAGTTWGGVAAVNALVWTGTQFCAVGGSGKVATSPDGVTWTYRGGLISTTWSTTNANAISWTGTQFCIVGDSGRVATSPDGIAWTYRSGLTTTTWSTTSARGIAWNSARFCVVGDNGRVATSADGITWTYQSELSGSSWSTTNARAIIWTGTQFCVVGDNGRTSVSTTGVTPVVIYQATQNLIGSTLLDWYEYFFLEQDTQRTQAIFADIPILNYTDTYSTITITGVGTISAGIITFGKIVTLGSTEYGASSGITDYSVKQTDEFGQTTFVRRAFSKRMSSRVLLTNAELNKVQRTLYDLRAVPSLWFASENPSLEEALVVFGYYRDFSTDISYPTYSYCSLEIEGLI